MLCPTLWGAKVLGSKCWGHSVGWSVGVGATMGAGATKAGATKKIFLFLKKVLTSTRYCDIIELQKEERRN